MLLYLANKVQRLALGALNFLSKLIGAFDQARYRTMAQNTPPKVLGIEALRTITTLLSKAPENDSQDFVSQDRFQDKAWSKSEGREELKALDAFSQLLVFDNEVVSVVSNRSRALRLIASRISAEELKAFNPEESDPEESDPDYYSTKFKEITQFIGYSINWAYELIATLNNRWEDSTTFTQKSGPELIDVKAPDGLEGKDILEFMSNLEANWSPPQRSTHVWILQEFLNTAVQQREDQALQSRLTAHMFSYIASMTCRKMQRRWRHLVSTQYLESLDRISADDIPLPSKMKHVPLTTGDVKEDHREGLNDYYLLQQVASHAEEFGIPIPALSTFELPNSQEHLESFNIYTDRTCGEYHVLLIQLIKRLKAALSKLSAPTDASKSTATTRAQYRQHMLEAQIFGYALLKVSGGRAFRRHIQNISNMLVMAFPTSGDAPAPTPTVTADANKEENGVEADVNDIDDELQALQTSRSPEYVAWLRLMISPFAAIEIVLRFVRASRRGLNSVSVKLLLPPHTSSALMNWRDLICDPRFFPQSDAASSLSTISNEDLVTFLEQSMEGALESRSRSSKAVAAENEWKQRSEKPRSYKFKSVTEGLALIGKEDIRDAQSMFNTWLTARQQFIEATSLANNPRYVKATTTMTKAEFDAIEKKIGNYIKKLLRMCSLPPGNFFYCSLANLEFRGAIHCEASLASLVDNGAQRDLYRVGEVDPEIYNELQKFGHTIGISKRSCPVCAKYLSLLQLVSEGLPYITRGTHSTAFGCTLPPWTPVEIVDAMVKHFSIILRSKLVALKIAASQDKIPRNRSDSTGSNALSSCSDDSYDGPPDLANSRKEYADISGRLKSGLPDN